MPDRIPPYLLPLALVIGILAASSPLRAQPALREKIGQMLMVTFTGDSLEESSASLDTLKSDLAGRKVGGVILFTWSGNLRNPEQIARLTRDLQRLSPTPLLISTDQEGGRVARLNASNGFANTPTAQDLGTVYRSELTTRGIAATMAGWLDSMGITMNLAPVVDLNVNPSSPAIGALQRSYSASADSVIMHAGWFIEEMQARGIITSLKHFPGHGSATTDSHFGLPDISLTWSPVELEPYRILIGRGIVDVVMPGHLFNASLDPLYPATLSASVVTGLLRGQLGFQGVVISDEMFMQAISENFGFDQAVILAVNAGVDILLFNRNLLTDGTGLASHLVDLIEGKVSDGTIPAYRIEESFDRIQALKARYLTAIADRTPAGIPIRIDLAAYPNPFNASTTLIVRLPSAGETTLEVFDILGRSVGRLYDGYLEAGSHRFSWSASGAASGIYIARLAVPGNAMTTRLLLLH